MNYLKAISATLGLVAFLTFSAPSAHADNWNKKTFFTFSGSVEIPGKVLPAGTYMFKLLDSQANRNVVQVFDKDGTHLYATLLAVPDSRLHPADKSVITFAERSGDTPPAIRAWFYPGDNFGQEFAYPRRRAIQLAVANNENVPAISDDAAASASKETPVIMVTPQSTDADTTNAMQPSAAPDNNLVAQNEQLPKTGSSVPLIALLGTLSLAMGVFLGVMRRCIS